MAVSESTDERFDGKVFSNNVRVHTNHYPFSLAAARRRRVALDRRMRGGFDSDLTGGDSSRTYRRAHSATRVANSYYARAQRGNRDCARVEW